MRQELDEKNDVMRMIFSDNEIAQTHEHHVGGGRHVQHLDANGALVLVEIHSYSKTVEHSAQTVREEFFASNELTQLVGRLKWSIVECKSSAVVNDGDRDIVANEFVIKTIKSPDQFAMQKVIQLSDLFNFAWAGGISTSPNGSGFALTSERSDIKSFCWDWFNVDTRGHATKLQEAGELAIEVGKVGDGWQVTRTAFLTDISIRVFRFGARVGKEPPEWRVNVMKGSYVNWPVLEDRLVKQYTK